MFTMLKPLMVTAIIQVSSLKTNKNKISCLIKSYHYNNYRIIGVKKFYS